MGSIDIIKALSTVLSCAVNMSQQHREKISCECRESNLGLLGEKQVCYLCAMPPPGTAVAYSALISRLKISWDRQCCYSKSNKVSNLAIMKEQGKLVIFHYAAIIFTTPKLNYCIYPIIRFNGWDQMK